MSNKPPVWETFHPIRHGDKVLFRPTGALQLSKNCLKVTLTWGTIKINLILSIVVFFQ